MYLTDGPDIFTTMRLIRDFARNHALQSRVAMTFIIASMALIMAWPTLASSMTGYTPDGGAFIKNYDGGFTPFEDFYPLAYTIHDAWRIYGNNSTPEQLIPFAQPDFYKGYSWRCKG